MQISAVLNLGQLALAVSFGDKHRKLVLLQRLVGLIYERLTRVHPGVFLELVARVKQMKCTVQIVNILTMRGSHTLPFYVWSIEIVGILPKAIVVIEGDQRCGIILLVHQRPVQKEVIVHCVYLAADLISYEIGKECTARQIASVRDVVRSCRVTASDSLNEVSLQLLGICNQ